MDPYSQYKKQLEYYDYVERQRKNCVDLTTENNSVEKFAKILFGKNFNNLNQDLTGIIFDDGHDVVEIFCMLVELVLYGIDILTDKKNNIFDLQELDDNIIDILKGYLKSAGFILKVDQEIIDEDDLNLYRDRDDYFCQIVKRPPEFLCVAGWYVLNYRLIENKKYHYNSLTVLENFKAFFITRQNKIFTFYFKTIS